MTLLTVIIANYNNGHLLQESVNSIFQASDINDLEILIVDDHSTDQSREVIEELRQRFHVSAHFREKNGGVEAAFNTGISLARGDYVHLFAADDHYLPGAAQTMIELIKQNTHISLFCSDHASFSEGNPQEIHTKKMLPASQFIHFSPQQIYRLFSHTDFWIPGHTVFARKTTYLSYGPQDKRLRSVADWYINHRIALDHGIGYFPGPLIARREDPHSYSSSIPMNERRAIWLYLLSLFRQSANNNKLSRSGICRILGLKAIYLDLLKKPSYWKYLFPMLRKETEKKCFDYLNVDLNAFWLRRLQMD